MLSELTQYLAGEDGDHIDVGFEGFFISFILVKYGGVIPDLLYPHHQTWPPSNPAFDDDQLEQQRHRQDPPIRQDLPPGSVDLDEHRFHNLCAL